uniref:Uncharacterized protein n=1 Tax=Rhizophagus irregularis (strain DAOM 181602 / DAOM 197198 / MUCL 43194) TaxID=747089 RepID=U9TLK0_RHIID
MEFQSLWKSQLFDIIVFTLFWYPYHVIFAPLYCDYSMLVGYRYIKVGEIGRLELEGSISSSKFDLRKDLIPYLGVWILGDIKISNKNSKFSLSKDLIPYTLNWLINKIEVLYCSKFGLRKKDLIPYSHGIYHVINRYKRPFKDMHNYARERSLINFYCATLL